MDVLEVQVEVSSHIFTDDLRELRRLEERIKQRLESVLGLSIRLKLVEPKTIARSEGKAQRVVDLRGQR